MLQHVFCSETVSLFQLGFKCLPSPDIILAAGFVEPTGVYFETDILIPIIWLLVVGHYLTSNVLTTIQKGGKSKEPLNDMLKVMQFCLNYCESCIHVSVFSSTHQLFVTVLEKILSWLEPSRLVLSLRGTVLFNFENIYWFMF